ncbi:MAG: translocation/assembly module TamB domain-containing protein [Bacteroidales bacterium]
MLFLVALAPVAAYVALQIPAIQTFSAHRVASLLSNKFGADVSIGRVYYIFFNKLIINDFHILYSEKDTLVNCNKLSVSISAADLIMDSKITLKRVHLDKGVINLVNETDSSTNLSRIFNLGNDKNDRTGFKLPDFIAGEVKLHNFRFSYTNPFSGTETKDGVINFSNLNLNRVNIHIRGIESHHDTLYAEVKNISFEERSGFNITKLQASLKLSPDKIALSNLDIAESNSRLKAHHFSLGFNSFKDFSSFTKSVRMESDFDKAYLDFVTLSRFAPSLSNNRLSFYISGLVSGTLSNLKTDNLKISSRSGLTYLDIKARISGLPVADETMAFVDIDYCTTTSNDIAQIVASINSTRPSKFFSNLSPLVKYNFSGRLAGLLDDFVANGNITTNIGNIYMDVLLKGNEQQGGVYLQGNLRANDFNVGSLIMSKEPGRLTFNSTMTAMLKEETKGGNEFYIDSITVKLLEFNNYPYSNISAAGSYLNDRFDGKIICHDPNLDFLFQGIAGLSTKSDSYYDFYADVMYANLFNLNLDNRDSVSSASLRTLAKFTQKINGEILGDIQVRDMEYTNSNGKFDIGDIFVKSSSGRDLYEASLSSSFARATFKGSHFIDRFITRLTEDLIYKHIPNLDFRDKEELEKRGDNRGSYNLNLVLSDTRSISQLLLPGFFISPGSKLDISIANDGPVKVNLFSATAGYMSNITNALNISATSEDDGITALLKADKIKFAGLEINNLRADASGDNNLIGLKIQYNNQTKLKNSLLFDSDIFIGKEAVNNRNLFTININPSELYFNDYKWILDKSSVTISDSLYSVNSFLAHNNNQLLHIDGTISASHNDSLTLSMANLDISPLNYFIKEELGVEGLFTGKATLTSLYSTPRILVNITGDNVKVNKAKVGELDLYSEWDNSGQIFNLMARSRLEGSIPLYATGTLSPSKNYLDLSANLDKFQVKYFEPFLKDIIGESSGSLSGLLRLEGPMDRLVLSSSRGMLNNVGFTVLFTKVPYILNGPFSIEESKLVVENATIRDRAGNSGRVNGGLSFPYFSNIAFNTKIDFSNLECINTTEKDNENFYGLAYGTGNISITGPVQKILMDISVTTNRNTAIHIPLPNTSVASRTNLLSFVALPEEKRENEYFNEYGYIVPVKSKDEKKSTELEVKLKTRVNTDAELLIEIDKSVGDVIRSYGNGLVNIDVNPSKDIFTVHGDYIINRGFYTFVLQGIFKRDFSIKDGGNLSFNGDILKTRLDLTAIYNTKASVNTLIADTSSVSNRRNVECSITMQGELLNPRLGFGINIPDIDPSTKARVDAALNTDDKVVKQVMSLLVSGSFIPDIQSSIVNNSTLLYSNATEVLSNQINNIFNQLDIPLDFSFNYQPGQNGRDIFDAAISAQLFDNRVIVNGNIGSSRYTNQNSDVVGDVDVEIKLDDKGRFRAKAFSHSADQYSNYLDNSQRSGVGLVYQEEFNSFRELFNRLFRSKKKREKVIK